MISWKNIACIKSHPFQKGKQYWKLWKVGIRNASWKISEIRAFPVLSSKSTDKYIKTGLFLSTQIKLKQDITFIYNFIIPCYSVQTLAIKCPSLDLTTSHCGLPSASKFKHFKNCCLTSNAFFMNRSDSLV